jgi:Zn-dependent protease with chaperone function
MVQQVIAMRQRVPRLRPLALTIVITASAALPAAAQSDEQTGAEVAKQVEEKIGIYRAPVTAEYVEAIGSRLVGNLEDNPYTFKFHIVDQFDPNAFALLGGWVYVSRGLLVLANTEDELAGVIGHEIIHITERHSANRQRRGMFGGILKIPGAVVGAVVSEDLGNLLNAPINTVTQISLASYSRSQESESDRLGMRLAAESGYDPIALADILAHLQADVEMLTGERHKSSFFDSHPFGPDAKFLYVFHGGSGSDKAQIKESLAYGVAKMNVDTDNQYAFTRAVAAHMFSRYDGVLKVDGEVGNKKAYDPRSYLKLAEEAMAQRVGEACDDLESSNRSLLS